MFLGGQPTSISFSGASNRVKLNGDETRYVVEQRSSSRNQKSLMRTYQHSMSEYYTQDLPRGTQPIYYTRDLGSAGATSLPGLLTHTKFTQDLDTSEPGSSRSYAQWPSNAVTTANLEIRPFTSEPLHQWLLPGQLMFVKRTMPDGGYSNAETVMNLQQLNTLLRRSYKKFQRIVATKYFNGVDRDATKSTLLSFFELPEPCWDRLVRDNENILNRDEDFALMRYLFTLGILDSWNLFGAMAVPPQNFYDVFQQRQRDDIAYSTVYVEGDLELEDIWGKQANSNSWLYIYLTRVIDPDTGKFGAYQFRTWASARKEIPEYVRKYQDWTGAWQHAVAWQIGYCFDRRGAAPLESDLDKMRGRIGVPQEQYEASYNAPKLHVLYCPKILFS